MTVEQHSHVLAGQVVDVSPQPQRSSAKRGGLKQVTTAGRTVSHIDVEYEPDYFEMAPRLGADIWVHPL